MKQWTEQLAGFLILIFIVVLAIDNHNICKYYEQELHKKDILIQELDTTLKKKEIVLDSVKSILSRTEKIYIPKFEKNSKFGEIYEYMKGKVKAPEATFALAVHETGGFTSKLAQNANNLFGFVYSPQSDFKYWSNGDGHYKSGWYDWKSSVDYMANWQDKFEKRGLDTSSNERYISSLRRIGYATDPLHGKKVKNTFNKYFDEVDSEEQAKLVILAAL